METRLHLNIFSHLIVVPGPVVDTCMAEVGGKPAERERERDRVNSVQPLTIVPHLSWLWMRVGLLTGK